MLKINLFFYFTICIFVEILLSINGDDSNRCTKKLTCSECIREDPQCSWCLREDISTNDEPLCNLKENLKDMGCEKTGLLEPENPVEFIENNNLTSEGANEGNAIQMKPQEIRLKLRPNVTGKFKIEVQQATDYPVDLYYLMDVSNTMKTSKENLAKLGKKLAEEMKNITSNFMLGFGTFIDKKIEPYTDTSHDRPCQGCDPSYGFKNNMELSSQTEKFAEEVNKAKISGNLDGPEGGFDALMQVIVCTKEIGWRNKSRKILLYSSDAEYHYAGDGKLGGLLEPNDEICSLDENGYYNMSTAYDYPSISQINRQLLNHKIHIIFAVTSSVKQLYENLSKRLTGSSTGQLDKDANNVVDLIREQYDKITSEVKMKDDLNDENIKLSYKTKCLGTRLENTNICKDIYFTAKVTFEMELQYAFCPPDRNQYNRTFNIFPAGWPDHLTVHLEMLCECDCEKPGNEEINSTKCSNRNGTFQCGICNCNENRSGRECECESNQIQVDEKDASCKKTNDSKLCSGFGYCDCGQCHCYHRENPEEKYYGKFCECNNFNCDRKDGKICSGPDRGFCDCGICKCKTGWKGNDCSCKSSEENCKDEQGMICSGRGYCHCGSCICNGTKTGEETYFGALCDDCATCPGKCEELKECVECQLRIRHGANVTCSPCESVTFDFVDKIEVQQEEKQCIFEGDEGCRYAFKYSSVKENTLLVSIRTSKECPEPLPVVQIASGVVGGVVATGLFLLMLWKILTTIHDRREFAKFNKERLKAQWNQDDNPLYVGAVQTFDNPSYMGH